MENNNKKISKKVLWTRIFCGFLAFLMVAGVAYLSVELIVDSVKTARAEAEAEAQKEAAKTTTKPKVTTPKPVTTTTPGTTKAPSGT